MADENGNTALLADVLKWKHRARELKSQNDTLSRRIETLEAESGKATKTLEAKVAELEQSLAKATAAPSEQAQRIKELEKELWTRDTRAKFEKVAKDAKVRDEALGDLWSLLGIDPEADAEITDESLSERVGEAVKARSYLLQSDPATGNGAAVPQQGQLKPAPREPGPGLSRGAPERSTPDDPRAAAIARVQQATGQTNPFRVA